MSAAEDFDLYFAECPLVAIIRGVTPDDAEATAAAIFEGGIRIIEVPLNSPRPFDSIETFLRQWLPGILMPRSRQLEHISTTSPTLRRGKLRRAAKRPMRTIQGRLPLVGGVVRPVCKHDVAG